MKADRAALLSLVLCFTLCLAALPAGAAPPLPKGPEIRVNTLTRALDHIKPAVAVFPDGGFVVAWAANTGNRVRFFNSQGRPTSGDRALRVGGRISQIITDRNGFLVVAAAAGADPSVSILLRRFHRNGTPQGPVIHANTESAHDWRDPIAAVGPKGLLGLAWAVERTDSDPERGNHTSAIGRIFSIEGTPLTPEITLVEGDGASAAGDDRLDAFPVDLVFKPNGTLVALVQDHDHGGGCLQSLLVLVPDGSSEPAEYLGLGSLGCGPPEHLEASVTVGRDGSLLAAWSEFGIQAQRFAPDETPGTAFSVSKDSVDTQLDPVSALQTGGSFVIAWTETTRDGDGKGIFGRAFAGNGLPRSGDFRINVTTAGDQHNPAIAAARQGPVVVVWLQPNELGGSDVFARVLSETR